MSKIDFEKLSIFRLAKGAHTAPQEGLCFMEAVSWLEGLPHSDHPDCTCPVIAAFIRPINDEMDDVTRQRLLAYLPKAIGTVSPQHEVARAEYLAWTAITEIAPAVLERYGLTASAARLRALPRCNWNAAVAVAASAAADDDAIAASTARCAAVAASAAAAASTARCAGIADRCAAVAASAAAAASTARCAARALGWGPAFRLLDGVLAIGPRSPGFSAPIEPRVEAYRELIKA